ncbi:MAG: hypothetical protein ACLFWD_01560 [Anaerolineales bacterium]
MKPSADIPHLRIVPTEKLHPHELPDEQRAQPLVSRLRRDRVLKNPPIVLPIEARDEYVVLDGANRVTALRLLGSPHSLVQVAHPNGDSVEVRTWNHVLMGLESAKAKSLLLRSETETKTNTMRTDQHSGDGAEKGFLRIHFADGEQSIFPGGERTLQERIKLLNEVVDTYRDDVHFERTSGDNLDGVREMYDSVAALVVFPEFDPEEVVEAASKNWHFPPGITRFIVSPRALRLNYPLAMLDGAEPVEEKQEHLNTWVRSRVRNRRVRFYAESTFLFDE